MSQRSGFPPLGEILRAADLISSAQLEVALQDQQYYQIRLGEIIALHGWLSQETADFFAEDWPRLTVSEVEHPLGYYLHRAALLNQEQIQAVLAEQKQMGVRFGAIAVLKGWLKQRTLDYFLENLVQTQSMSAFQGKQDLKLQVTQSGVKEKNEENQDDEDYSSSVQISDSVIILPDNYPVKNKPPGKQKESSKVQGKPLIQLPKNKKIAQAIAAQKLLDG
ncbi:MAG: hypothetical protein ACRC6M_10715, partial [Microcystaceae cyanobacterium]